MHNQFIKSKPCKNCGEWVLEEKAFLLENEMKELYEYVNKSESISKKDKDFLLKKLLIR